MVNSGLAGTGRSLAGAMRNLLRMPPACGMPRAPGRTRGGGGGGPSSGLVFLPLCPSASVVSTACRMAPCRKTAEADPPVAAGTRGTRGGSQVRCRGSEWTHGGAPSSVAGPARPQTSTPFSSALLLPVPGPLALGLAITQPNAVAAAQQQPLAIGGRHARSGSGPAESLPSPGVLLEQEGAFSGLAQHRRSLRQPGACSLAHHTAGTCTHLHPPAPTCTQYMRSW